MKMGCTCAAPSTAACSAGLSCSRSPCLEEPSANPSTNPRGGRGCTCGCKRTLRNHSIVLGPAMAAKAGRGREGGARRQRRVRPSVDAREGVRAWANTVATARLCARSVTPNLDAASSTDRRRRIHTPDTTPGSAPSSRAWRLAPTTRDVTSWALGRRMRSGYARAACVPCLGTTPAACIHFHARRGRSLTKRGWGTGRRRGAQGRVEVHGR